VKLSIMCFYIFYHVSSVHDLVYLGMFWHSVVLNKNPDFVHTTNHGIL